MVFWNTQPVRWPSFWHTERFQSLTYEKDAISSPTGQGAQRVNSTDRMTLSSIRQFLRSHFGTPPSSPLLDISEDRLLGPFDYLFYVKDTSSEIAGCIRYHAMGTLLSDRSHPQMYLVDCFCIHPAWRKKGVGDYLLTILHRFANRHHIPYALFLKEGSPLPILSLPLYTGYYVYKRIAPHQRTHPFLYTPTTQEAYRIMDIFHASDPTLFIIRSESPTNPRWRLYRDPQRHHLVLTCIQDTHQRFKGEDGETKRMGWITAWFESPTITDNNRGLISTVIADSLHGEFDYIWSDSKWTGHSTLPSSEWIQDGTFHWYTYQWSTSLNIKKGYCILH